MRAKSSHQEGLNKLLKQKFQQIELKVHPPKVIESMIYHKIALLNTT